MLLFNIAGLQLHIYLYGLGAIGEKTTAWNFSMPDGTNTPRQLSNSSGEITLSARYTPWGDTLEWNGTGNFTYGYFGSVMDAATGLIYVGSGQYYDPETGRFLTRDAKPNNTNPYVPWDPSGAIIAPLGIVALFAGRKKKGSKLGTFLVLLLVLGSVGMTLSACVPGPATVTVVSTPGVPLATATATFADASTVSFATPMPNGTPSQVLGVPCPTPSGNEPAPIPTSTPTFIGKFVLSAYYIPTEDQYRKNGGAKVSIPAVEQRSIDIVGDPSVKLYLSQTHKYDYEWNVANHRQAIWGFLYDVEQGICVQGTGKLDSGEYISCTVPPGTPLDKYRFDWQLPEKVNSLQNSVRPFDTVAVCYNKSTGQQSVLHPYMNREIVIPELSAYLQEHGNNDTTLTVTDTGEGLCTQPETLDLYVGEGQDGLNAYHSAINPPTPHEVDVYVK